MIDHYIKSKTKVASVEITSFAIASLFAQEIASGEPSGGAALVATGVVAIGAICDARGWPPGGGIDRVGLSGVEGIPGFVGSARRAGASVFDSIGGMAGLLGRSGAVPFEVCTSVCGFGIFGDGIATRFPPGEGAPPLPLGAPPLGAPPLGPPPLPLDAPRGPAPDFGGIDGGACDAPPCATFGGIGGGPPPLPLCGSGRLPL
eukprot:CAMPEP_0117034218 /NCGR_PEP_ID=MMETSP0472-20121206/24382_1 /TAXON_ID=693140 ORGANISM="Tiarina fusus, Strain LIS" /NCGR_SAMPLE_ID=MMETSP0472 /ASSEMBLY_ACC=CAM_ASM_000603 /LENGTH=202 /DNA_ID=CAMNT_0004743335 /DNA_START=739 /DNA_END=1345 /DNA_ORIENTATION=-